MRIIYSVKFHQKLHIFPLIRNFDYKKIFLFTNFHYHLIPRLSMVMRWIEFYEVKLLKLGKYNHQDNQKIFQPKLHYFFIPTTNIYYYLPN